MDSETRMSVRRSLIPLALAACATAAAVSCRDPSPVGVDIQAPAVQASGWRPTVTTESGLVPCAQTYDSVTQVIGPAGGRSEERRVGKEGRGRGGGWEDEDKRSRTQQKGGGTERRIRRGH